MDDRVLVNEGVEEGDQVVVRGLQSVRPGMPVQVRSVNTPGDPATEADGAAQDA